MTFSLGSQVFSGWPCLAADALNGLRALRGISASNGRFAIMFRHLR
jgi:hypothetical protein